MSDIVLKVENLSKLYRLGEVGTGTISHDLNRWWAKVRGKEDPYALVGQVNDRSQKAESDYVWSLRDINFEVKQGEVLGVIGKNGAGKSTLLKLISQITSPTTGSIKAKGRIASLLEVGTGMNPELTARENIYLNGAILGMTKKEISSKFDEIVDFSGCTMYVDTPVKRFSSGMRVRLGFAVAAFLEPEILIVDEVLAVGDAEFQKKAIGKMKDISAGGGRTVLFVSHNMAAVKSLCNRCILLNNGELIFNSSPELAIMKYLASEETSDNIIIIDKSIDNIFHLKEIEIYSSDRGNKVLIHEQIKIIVSIQILENSTWGYHANLFITDGSDLIVFAMSSRDIQLKDKGIYAVEFTIPSNFINNIFYGIDLNIIKNQSESIYYKKNILTIEGVDIAKREGWLGKVPGILRPTNFVGKTIKLV